MAEPAAAGEWVIDQVLAVSVVMPAEVATAALRARAVLAGVVAWVAVGVSTRLAAPSH
jgi:hypothetical protein